MCVENLLRKRFELTNGKKRWSEKRQFIKILFREWKNGSHERNSPCFNVCAWRDIWHRANLEFIGCHYYEKFIDLNGKCNGTVASAANMKLKVTLDETKNILFSSRIDNSDKHHSYSSDFRHPTKNSQM